MPQQNSDAFQIQGPTSTTSEPLLKSRYVKVAAEFTPGASRAAQQTQSVSVKPKDILEIEFEDGQRVWMRADEYRARFAAKSRDGSGPLEVAREIEPLPTGQQLARGGPFKLLVKTMRVLGVDLQGETAEQIAAKIEKGRLGLVRCSLGSSGLQLEKLAAVPESPDPYLILIHGTGSSTAGSFSELWKHQQWTSLLNAYPNRVLALDHATLSKNPIENAIEIASKLPKNARLHLLSHSRGGLIGELLCRAGLGKPFSAQELDLFDSSDKRRSHLDALAKELTARQVQVERFVRVACPTLGTTLASGRLDRWLSVIASVCGNAARATMAGEFVHDMADFIAAVVHERTNPDRLPGLEAMMPESRFIQLLNWPTTQVSGDLAVVSGDIQKESWGAKLLIWVTDRFYSGDHDLVVNTASMYGGVRRAGQSVRSFHKGPEVSHFNYFINDSSVRRITEALAGNLSGFEPLTKPTVDIARAVEKPSSEPRPIVVLLPGIMGSELSVGDDHVWLQIPDIVFGGLSKLHIKAKNVRAIAPFARAYGDIIRYLAATHKVVPFPFDWRLPVEKEADRLAKTLQDELEAARRHKLPIRLLAHSMGGLVARTMIARHQSLWREICSYQGSRLVMLGTPNGGSHCITELLVAKSSTLKKLSLVDLRHDKRKLLEIISRFPGVLAMLPKDSVEDYFASATWSRYQGKDKDRKDWLEPDSADLKAARDFRTLIDSSPIDPAHMAYLAGRSDATPAAMKLDGDTVRILATPRGDGSVTWELGLLPGVPTFFCNTVHGDLAADARLFDAIRDLLENGQTARLPKEAPVSRAAEVLFEMPAAEDEMYPTRDVLSATVLGSRGETAEPPKTVAPITMRIVHGHLQYATHPIAVGHYAGDPIVSAESHVDRALGGTLKNKHALNLYPSAIGDSAIFFNQSGQPCPAGAIVVGLGDVGTLTASQLTRTFTRALLNFAVESNQCGCRSLRPNLELGVSPLLIGTNAGGISVNDSVFAILQAAVAANDALKAAGSSQRFAEIEFVEIYEDRALMAASALHQLQQSPHRDNFVFDGRIRSADGARYRLTMEEPPGWWQRLQIRSKPDDPAAQSDGTLRFISVTKRARNEMKVLATQRRLVDQFIEKSISTTRDNREIAKTLFELLLPNELKDQSPDQDDLVLMVDDESARYPWEMLEDSLNGDGPFAVKHGLIRQLESGEYRKQVRSTQEKTALIVGDPQSSFPELPGAQAEAELVGRVLQNGGFTGDPLIRPTARDVMRALFRQPYRVVHLAAHGVYQYLPENSEPGAKPVTGMIIGDGMVLSPNEVEQMRVVPELVFINCCHLGRIEPREARFSSIAANVSTQFIRMGVRAVVAAGWAVDDQAANTFARVFYEEMLSGQTFGKAVHEARRATFQQHGSTNTWGAYQCYGDQEYQLVPRSRDSQGKPPRFASPSEARVEIENVAAALSTRAAESVAWEKSRLDQIADVCKDAGWLKRGDLLGTLGRAYRDANERATAIEYLQKALNTEDGKGSLKDLEQLLNLQVRQAAEKADVSTIRNCIKQLERIVDSKEYVSGTGERLALLASAHKREASLTPTADRSKPLANMAKRYKEAFDWTGRPYQQLNWLTAEVVLDWYSRPRARAARQRIDGFDRMLDELSAKLSTGCGSDQWDIVMSADARLVQALASGKIDAGELGKMYRERRARVSHGAFASVPEHIDFLIAMAKGDIKKGLVKLRESI